MNNKNDIRTLYISTIIQLLNHVIPSNSGYSILKSNKFPNFEVATFGLQSQFSSEIQKHSVLKLSLIHI